MRDAVYSPVHAFGLLGHVLFALATPSARITAANLHAMFADFSSARGLVNILPKAGRRGADALNVSVLAQTYAHFFSIARRADLVRPPAAAAGAERVALTFSVAGRSNFSALAAVGFQRGDGKEDFVMINRAPRALNVDVGVRAAGGASYRVAEYASDKPSAIAGFATVELFPPPPLPWPGPMPVSLSTAKSSPSPSSSLSLALAPLSLLIVEQM